MNRANEMIKYVESYYRSSKMYMAQNNAKGIEFDIIHTILDDLPNQFNPQTATWAIKLWEELLEIESSPNKTIEEKRIDILLKLKPMKSITPISMGRLIQKVTNAKISLIRNIAPYTFQIKIDESHYDSDIKKIIEVVEEYKEAHMAYILNFINKVLMIFKVNSEIIFYASFNPLHTEKIRRINGTNFLDGVYLLTGCKSKKRMDNYPLQVTTMQTAKQKIRYKTFYYYQCNNTKLQNNILSKTMVYSYFNPLHETKKEKDNYPLQITTIQTIKQEVCYKTFYHYQCNTKLQTNILAKTIIYSWFNPLQDYLLQIMNMHIIKQEVKIPVKLTVWRKWGQLDGKNQLNGTRTLAAEKFEYEE